MESKPPRAVVVISGGLDSTTLAYLCLERFGNRLHLLSFDYGQRHIKELGFARETAARLHADWTRVDMSFMKLLLTGSSLTDAAVPVPHGHYAAESMKATIVPNRNAMMLSIAYAIAVAEGATDVAAGFHAGDHPIYPDCRPEFASAFYAMEVSANGGSAPALYTPFIMSSKEDIVRTGDALSVPFNNTWSCYEGGEIHCGRCGTCVERKEAFRLAEVYDPTMYEDPNFEIRANRY